MYVLNVNVGGSRHGDGAKNDISFAGFHPPPPPPAPARPPASQPASPPLFSIFRVSAAVLFGVLLVCVPCLFLIMLFLTHPSVGVAVVGLGQNVPGQLSSSCEEVPVREAISRAHCTGSGLRHKRLGRVVRPSAFEVFFG